MIDIREGQEQFFLIQMAESSYWLEINAEASVNLLYYGPKLPLQSPTAMRLRRSINLGAAVVEEGSLINPDMEAYEFSTYGRGDYRPAALALTLEDGRQIFNFEYRSYRYRSLAEAPSAEEWPKGYPRFNAAGSEALCLTLEDKLHGLELDLHYLIFPEFNVILRHSCVRNQGQGTAILTRLMSSCLDIPERGFELLSLHGLWAKEAHLQRQNLGIGSYSFGSTVGTSSNRHNPAFALLSYRRDFAYGFNLLYSGNHFVEIHKDHWGQIRILQGINPEAFRFTLAPGDRFETPMALLSFAKGGENELSAVLHRFINERVIAAHAKRQPKDIVFNNWEATHMDFNERKLLRFAKTMKKLGCELFMLDDGWFGERNDDLRGLGDYWVNRQKFPDGLGSFFDKVRAMGLKTGIWVEPEMVNPDSDLYREHPDWAIQIPGLKARTGRHQLVLDLTRIEVRDYIVDSLGRLFDEVKPDRIKWDMNRYLSDIYSRSCPAGEVMHRYVLGLYEILERVFGPRPDLRVEMCSSGGNRFDLGMLCYADQIWVSDDTDPIERLHIQGGLIHFYPQSCLSNHVALAPHHSTLRYTPLSTRFNVAAFGVLGYELDPAELSPLERKEIREQIEYYKARREIFQFGRFDRIEADRPNQKIWQIQSTDTTLCGYFQEQCEAITPIDRLYVKGLKAESCYRLEQKTQRLFLNRFGTLLKFAMPVKLKADGLILNRLNRYYALEEAGTSEIVSGAQLTAGLPLPYQFAGSGYNETLRMMGDFGSYLYEIKELQGEDGGMK